MGFIPTAPVDDATYDARRFPYNGVDYGLHSARSLSAIPDEVVSRPTDDNAISSNYEAGLVFQTSKSYKSIGAVISQNTTGFSTAYLEDGTQNSIATTDISSLSAGDAFSFETVDLPAGEYIIYIDCNLAGYHDRSNYPYTGTNIDIIHQYSNGYIDPGQEPRGVNDIGNPQGVLG